MRSRERDGCIYGRASNGNAAAKISDVDYGLTESNYACGRRRAREHCDAGGRHVVRRSAESEKEKLTNADSGRNGQRTRGHENKVEREHNKGRQMKSGMTH